ncbi:MAG: sigma-70 family RNA polymerase sigma factor [Oscillospiraceae bacterium]|nr:sigma-70 family RNA polymerase sigma factor [Oscillospiraceae bacterium]
MSGGDGKFFVRVTGELVEVTEEVYRAYYSMARHELTLTEKDARHGLMSYDVLPDSGDTLAHASDDVETQTVTKLTNERLRACLARLADDERELLRALYFEERSIAELSRETGVATRTLGYRRDKALERLRKLMNARE